MTAKKCAFCGSTRNVTYEDPAIGPICQRCWLVAGDEEEGEKKKPGGQGPGGAKEDPKQETER